MADGMGMDDVGRWAVGDAVTQFGAYSRILVDERTGEVALVVYDAGGCDDPPRPIKAEDLGALFVQLAFAGYWFRKEYEDPLNHMTVFLAAEWPAQKDEAKL